MGQSLQVQKLAPSIIEPDQIGLDIVAALTERDGNADLAIPGVHFEVRVGVNKLYEGVSDSKTGAFLVEKIPVGEFGPRFEVIISAKSEEAEEIAVTVSVSVESVMLQIEARHNEAAQERARLELLEPEAAERARQDKDAIKGALKGVEGDRDLRNHFEVLVRYQNHPFLKREIVGVARLNPMVFILYAHVYCMASWAEDVLSELAIGEPQKVLGEFHYFYKYPWAKNIVTQIAEAHPDVAFSEIERYEYMTWAGEIAMNAAVIDPKSAVKYYDKYRDQPWAEGVFQFAKPLADRIDLDMARLHEIGEKIDAYCLLLLQPHSEEDEENAFKFFIEYQHDGRMESALCKLAESNHLIFSCRIIYRGCAWAEKVDVIVHRKMVAVWQLVEQKAAAQLLIEQEVAAEQLEKDLLDPHSQASQEARDAATLRALEDF